MSDAAATISQPISAAEQIAARLDLAPLLKGRIVVIGLGGIGSILAGPRQLLENMYHVRRMFGGNLAIGWPAVLVARHYMDGFLDRLTNAGFRMTPDLRRLLLEQVGEHP